MAVLYISEFQNMAGVGSRWLNVAPMPPLAEQTLAIGGASAPSNAFGATTNVIRVTTDSVCSIAIGAAPAATVATMRLAANAVEYFAVSPGQKLAVIANT